MRWYVPHLQIFPAICSSISASVGFGFVASSDTACMICPGWQYPHCGTFTSAHAFCTACGPCAEIPSMVVISPETVPICFWHDRIAFPFSSTVHAPHSAMPHPNFVPVSPRMSRRYQDSGISGSPSNDCATPLTLKRVMTTVPERLRCELTAYSTADQAAARNGCCHTVKRTQTRSLLEEGPWGQRSRLAGCRGPSRPRAEIRCADLFLPMRRRKLLRIKRARSQFHIRLNVRVVL